MAKSWLNSYNKTIDQAINIIKTSNVKYIEDLIELIDKGFLFYSTNNEEKREGIISNKMTMNLSFSLGDRCNLNCGYCYFRQKQRPPKDLNFIKFFDFIDSMYKSYSKINLQLGQGGEPFLYPNEMRQLLYRFKVLKSKGRMLSLIVITNGTVYDRQLLKELSEIDATLVVSIDGDESSHNATRKFKNGKGSYSNVYFNIKKILGNDSLSRITRNIWTISIVSSEMRSIKDSLIELYKLGIRTTQFRLVKGSNIDSGINNNLDHFISLYRELFDFLEKNITVNGDLQYLLMILNNGDTAGQVMINILLSKHNFKRCNASIRTLCIDIDGEAYPCTFLNALPYFKLGNIYDNICNISFDERFLNNSIENNKTCNDCWAATVCGGFCPYHSLETVKNILQPDKNYCKIIQFILERSINIINILEDKDQLMYTKIYSYAEKRYKLLEEEDI